MATLIKRKGSPYFFAAFDVRQADGTTRRLKKSNKRTKRSEALVEAARLEHLACAASDSTAENATAAYAVLSEAANAAAKGELSENRARELLARLYEISTDDELQFYTVRRWATDWLAKKLRTAKPATSVVYKAHIEAFVAWLGDKADGKLETVNKKDARDFRDAIQDGWVGNRPAADQRRKTRITPHVNRTAATTNNYAVTVGSIFRSAIREGLLLANPCASLERLPEIDSIQREVFTVAEINRLIESAGNTDWQTKVFPNETDAKIISARCHEWQGMILFGFYAATRIGDASNLKWSNIDLEHKTVTFMPAKTDRKKKVLTLPLHPRLVAYLEPRAADTTPEMSLFPSLVLRGSSGDKGLSSQFIAIMETGGIDRRELRQDMKKGVRAQYARSYHALRHSLTAALANADVPEDIRRQITGHDSAETHRIYTHSSNATLARAVEKMPSV